ncbi:MAG: response regulator [Chloroflexi bacterium]|nr:response regulator [Chloroflexota bacterium]
MDEILVVEDSRTQAEELKHILEAEGYQVTVAANGREALESLALRLPAAVISDIVMPEMDGFTLCRRIKEDTRSQTVPVILVTALRDPDDVIRGLECGADNFITKPMDTRYFKAHLQSLLLNRDLYSQDQTQMGIEVFFGGQKHFISSNRLQILNLLLSTYDSAVKVNQRLVDAESKVEEHSRALRSVEEQFAQAQKMEAVSRLAGGVAHDFNNMLMVIQGFTDIMLRSTPAESTHVRYLQEIRKATDRAASVSDQLLAFSRKKVFQLEIFDLNSLIGETTKLLNRLLGESIALELSLAPERCSISADRSQVVQILMNLAANALDAMPNGGTLTLKTSCGHLDEEQRKHLPEARPCRYVVLTVGDTGIGMDAEVLGHLFEPFFTTKEIGRGTGLGLATVYGIVKQSGGFIRGASEPGKGAEFSLYLPETDPGDEKSAPDPAMVPPVAREVILLVEDEESVRAATRQILQENGYTVVEADNGRKALDMFPLLAKKPDLVLSDIVMPEVGGAEMAEQLRRLHPSLPVIFMSGYSDQRAQEAARLLPLSVLLQKPVQRKILLAAIRKALDER